MRGLDTKKTAPARPEVRHHALYLGIASRARLPCAIHGAEELLVAERFTEKRHRAVLHGARRYSRIAVLVGADEDDRNTHPGLCQPLLQLVPGDAREPLVEHQATSRG